MKKLLFLIILITLLLVNPVTNADYHPVENYEVLLLHSYHKSYEWTEKIDQGIKDSFAEQDIAINFKTEYLDTKNYNSEQYFNNLYNLYQNKYQGKDFDLIIISDDYGLNFLANYKENLFANTPVVFCGINNYQQVSANLDNQYTGVIENINFKDSIKTALELHPKTEKIIVLADKSISGTNNVNLVDESLADYFHQIDYKIYRFTDINRVEKVVKNTKQGTIIFLAGIFKDKNDNLIPPEKIAEFLDSKTKQPIYSSWDFYLGHGIVGGKLVSAYHHGFKAASMGGEILRGTKPAEIKIATEEATKYMFDAQQLNKFKISQKQLPEDSTIINEQKSYYQLNKKLVWQISIGSFILFFIIIVLSINILKRREAENELKGINKQLEYQLELEELIARLSTEFISIELSDLGHQMEEALKLVGQDLKADRSYIFLINYCKEEMSNIWEWSAKGVEPQKDILQNLPLDVFPWVMEKLMNNEEVLIKDVNELPPEAAVKEILLEQDIKSLILIPIKGKNRLMGYWGVDAVSEKKVWSNDIINLLKIVSEIFGNALQQKDYQEKLEESQERLEFALWGAEVGLWDWDITTDEVHFNEQWARMLGYELSEISKDFSGWKDLIHPEDEEETIADLKRHLAGESDYYESEHRLKTKGGNWKWVLDRGRVVSKDENGEATRAVGVHLDITRRKELSNLKSELISTVSHEIRTPLTSVLGFTELLIERDLSTEIQQKYLKMIHQESNRLKNLINDFLDIQKIEEKKADFNFVEVDIVKIAQEVVDLYQTHAERNFKFELSAEKIIVTADSNKLKQVLTNLISNAVKYSTTDTTIKIKINEQQELVQVAVQDQGMGISKEDYDNLFNKFYRTKQVVKNQIEGTGLGLAICKKIVETHGGSIWVESELNKGSTFYFTIPKNSGGDHNG